MKRGTHVLPRRASTIEDDFGTVRGATGGGVLRVYWHFSQETYDEDPADLVAVETSAHAARIIALFLRTHGAPTSPEVRHAGGDSDAFDVHIGKLRIAVSCSLPD